MTAVLLTDEGCILLIHSWPLSINSFGTCNANLMLSFFSACVLSMIHIIIELIVIGLLNCYSPLIYIMEIMEITRGHEHLDIEKKKK